MKNLGVIVALLTLAQGAFAETNDDKTEANQLTLAFNETLLLRKQPLQIPAAPEAQAELDLSAINAKLEMKFEQQLHERLESQLVQLNQE